MSVFNALDKICPHDISNLIVSFFPYTDIYPWARRSDRVFTYIKGKFGLQVPRRAFSDTVWFGRYSNPDSSAGIKLLSAEKVSYPVDTDHILIEIFHSISLSAHTQCNSFIRKLLLDSGPPTSGEVTYLNSHFICDWLAAFKIITAELPTCEFELQGYGFLFIKLYRRILESEHIEEAVKVILINYIATEVFKPSATFRGLLKLCRSDFRAIAILAGEYVDNPPLIE